MCLAIPAEVVELKPGEQAIVSLDGLRKEISLALVEGIAVGDFVLVHVGYALHKISQEEAERTLKIMEEAGILAEERSDIEGDAA